MARSFNGTSDFIDIPSFPLSTLVGIPWTLSAWCYPLSGIGPYPQIIGNSATTDRLFIGMAVGGYAGMNIYYHALQTKCTTVLANSTWTHVAITYTNTTTVAVYLNGVVDPNGCQGTYIGVQTGNVQIGSDSHGNCSFWKGRIAEVVFYNGLLTADEIYALAKGARPNQVGQSVGIIPWLPLDGLESPEPDLSGNFHNGTLTGTALADGPPATMFTPRWPINSEQAAAPSFIPAWAMNTNLPVLGTGNF